MKFVLLYTAALLLVTIVARAADPAVQEAQRALKDQGFYYGEVTGVKDAETTAAVRRYQIRSGLQVSGELNAETISSLRSAPAATATPRTAITQSTPVIRDLTNDSDTSSGGLAPQASANEPADDQQQALTQPQSGTPQSARTVFAGTPYDAAPLDVQRSIVAEAQSVLARRGYYKGAIDGAYGPSTEFALRAFQSQAGMQPSGAFDMPTLQSLRLLPGERFPRRIAPRRPYAEPPVVRGEWIRE